MIKILNIIGARPQIIKAAAITRAIKNKFSDSIQEIMRVFIIAEAGVNHNGDIKLAKQLIDVAKDAEADYVKFQTFKTELAISKNTISKKTFTHKWRVMFL